MSSDTTIGPLREDQNVLRQEFSWADKTPSWLLPHRKGNASLDMCGHTGAGWLTLDAMERARTATKRTIVTLDRGAVAALRDFCNRVLQEGPK